MAKVGSHMSAKFVEYFQPDRWILTHLDAKGQLLLDCFGLQSFIGKLQLDIIYYNNIQRVDK